MLVGYIAHRFIGYSSCTIKIVYSFFLRSYYAHRIIPPVERKQELGSSKRGIKFLAHILYEVKRSSISIPKVREKRWLMESEIARRDRMAFFDLRLSNSNQHFPEKCQLLCIVGLRFCRVSLDKQELFQKWNVCFQSYDFLENEESNYRDWQYSCGKLILLH